MIKWIRHRTALAITINTKSYRWYLLKIMYSLILFFSPIFSKWPIHMHTFKNRAIEKNVDLRFLRSIKISSWWSNTAWSTFPSFSSYKTQNTNYLIAIAILKTKVAFIIIINNSILKLAILKILCTLNPAYIKKAKFSEHKISSQPWKYKNRIFHSGILFVYILNYYI